MRFRTFGLALAFAAGLAGSAAEAQQGNTISVPVTGLRNNIGDVRFSGKRNDPASDAAHADISGQLPGASEWRR